MAEQSTRAPPLAEPAPIRPIALALGSVLVGLIAGAGAIVFRDLIGAFHNLFFLGQLSLHYDANVHTPASPWGPWIVAVPALGAVGVVFLVKTFAPEAKGHGVPEVMSAVYHHAGVIRPVVAVVKSLASALCIGSGGAVGREGPIVQIGAAFGSTLGQWVAMPASQRSVLVAAGAGGGIAATFDAPIGGILFAVELLLPVVNARNVLCVALATVTATAIGRLAFGVFPAFYVPALVSGPSTVAPSALPWFLLLGGALGLVAWAMTRGVYWFEDLFERMPGNDYARHVIGMLVVGAMLAGFATFSSSGFGQPDRYYVEGVGYATMMDILRGGLTAAGFLALLGAAKLLAMCLTLGSGGSGGVFSPCLFVGAALGAAFGALLGEVVPALGASPSAFAIAGMAALVGGTTGAVLTAIAMILEMTRDPASSSRSS